MACGNRCSRTRPGILPEDVRNQPKSPPKTHNPLFERLAKERLRGVLADPTHPSTAWWMWKCSATVSLKDAGDYERPWFRSADGRPPDDRLLD